MRNSRTLPFVLLLAAWLLAAGCESPPRSQQPPVTHTEKPRPAPEPAAPPPVAEKPVVEKPVAARPLHELSEKEFAAHLAALAERQPDVRQRVVELARGTLGQPYEIYLLGEFPYELYDPDPIYNLARSDCLTFVEHCYAAALSSDFMSYLRALQRIRYKDGVIGMLTRNHFTEADWNPNNAFLLTDVTAALAPDSEPAHVPLTQVTRRAAFFAKFRIGEDIPDQELVDTYIPSANVPRIADALREADMIQIVRGSEASQWVGHTGFFVRGADGAAHFLHSANPQVREEPLTEYLAKDARSVGIKVLRLKDDPAAAMAAGLREATAATPIDEETLSGALCDARRVLIKPALESLRVDHSRRCNADWRAAMSVQALRLEKNTPTDPALQSALERIDAAVAAELGMPEESRALGVLDLQTGAFAAFRPDAIFYGASVPKISIAHAMLERFPHQFLDYDELLFDKMSRMLKRSDNAIAAELSQGPGLEYIMELQCGDKYRFYDKEHGGLWTGKHYGIDAPRVADPIGGHSHAVTVRQCLRFYLLMEQGKLVNARLSATLQSLFAAPKLAFHNHNFVAGLHGRNASLIRKSGTWEDWHLDTARVRHNGRTYLIAGATHHPRGEDYLARVVAGIDEHLCGADQRPWPYAHHLYYHAMQPPAAGVPVTRHVPPAGDMTVRPAANEQHYTLAAIHADEPFNEALVSWNITAPPNAGYVIELRVGRFEENLWSPWLRLATVGAPLPAGAPEVTFALRDGENPLGAGRIDVDYFRSDDQFTGYQVRIRAATQSATPAVVRLEHVAVCLSDMSGIPRSLPPRITDAGNDANPMPESVRRLPVPFRSQKVERKELAGRVCSPTSLAMVMAYRGVERPTQEVCERAFDKANNIYGNWPLNVQAAFEFGVPGFLTRFSNWADVERSIIAGQPLIISVRSAEPGALRGAPYRQTDGHLLVLCGFDAEGRVLVNDPAAPDAAGGQLAYHREDLERAWMRATGGVAYVLLEPPAQGAP
ncbi:MAG: DUF1460 domain-containing protein [Phycisphaerales bacterium]|nr:DUF1460 domain-containing protein [Phycisphaerales bacterium]